MAGITGMGTTFNLPNYTGDLFAITPSSTPFLSAAGGLTGGESVESTEFEWQVYDLRAAGQNTATEGADAPTGESRVRENVTNVVQIHQEVVDVSYTKLAADQLKSGTNNALRNPVTDELDWQVEQMLKQIARDVDYSFIQGVYAKPADNTTARQTRGLLNAITTNHVVAPDGDTSATGTQPSDLTADVVLDLLQQIWDNGGITEEETATIVVNSFQKRQLTQAFITNRNYQENSRSMGGVSVSTIETDFGELSVMLERHMPADEVLVASMDMVSPVLLLVPDKGFLFAEPLAKTGARSRSQIYGEIGLRYGKESAHGKITNLTTS